MRKPILICKPLLAGKLPCLEPAASGGIPVRRVSYSSAEDRLGECFQSSESLAEMFRQGLRQLQLSAPSRPSGLTNFCIAFKRTIDARKFNAPVVRYYLHCLAYLHSLEDVATSELINVTKIPPSSTRLAALERCDDLLGYYHLQRVTIELYRFLFQQPGQEDLHRCGPDRVTNVDVNMKWLSSGCQPSDKANPYAAVYLFFSYCFRSYIVQVERESIIQLCWQLGGGDLCDELTHGLHLIRDLDACEVDVGGWSAHLVSREQHTSLEHERVTVLGIGQTKQETL